MRACQVIGRGHAALTEIGDPRAEPGDVLVRPTRVGICGTDLHILHDLALVDENDLPLTLGHEFVGEVMADPGGSAGPPLHAGQRVTVEPLVPCWRCALCLRGRPNLCRRMSHLGIWRAGCMADLVSVPRARVVPVPDALDDLEAALVELYACAVNFVEKARMSPGAHCAVIGGGPVGLATAQCAVASGAAGVALVEPQAGRRRFAREIGIEEVHATAHEAIDALAERTSIAGADVVFECVGAGPAIASSLQVAGKGGRVVMAGIPTAEVTLDWTPLVTNELEVVGAFASAWAFERAMDLMVAGRIDPASLVTATRPFEEVVDALVQATGASECKIHLDMA